MTLCSGITDGLVRIPFTIIMYTNKTRCWTASQHSYMYFTLRTLCAFIVPIPVYSSVKRFSVCISWTMLWYYVNWYS